MGLAPDFIDGRRLIGSYFAAEHFDGFLNVSPAKMQLLDFSEDLLQFLRGFVEGCAIGFWIIVYFVFHNLPHTRILMHRALKRDCTIVVPKYNCPAKSLSCKATIALKCIPR